MAAKFIPEVGKVYKMSRLESYYRALAVYVYPDHVGQVDAIMQNVDSGWTVLTHNIRQDDDGNIFWSCSSGGYFMGVK